MPLPPLVLLRGSPFSNYGAFRGGFRDPSHYSINSIRSIRVEEAESVRRPSEAVRVRTYNDATKAVAAPHVSHYDFSALLLIKMQIYRGRGAREIGR